MNFKSRAFPHLAHLLSNKSIHGICDLGECTSGTLAYYSKAGVSVQFLDWINIIAEKGLPDVSDVEHTPNLELIVCWDLFHFLDDVQLNKFANVLSTTLKKNGHIVFLLRRDAKAPDNLSSFAIDADGVHVSIREKIQTTGYDRSRREIERLFPKSKIIQSTILQNGYVEYLGKL